MRIRIRAFRLALIAGALALGYAGCGKDAVKPDTTAPGSVRDLTATAVNDTSITLSWTAPGDDGARARAISRYRIRISPDSRIVSNQEIWDSAYELRNPPSPGAPGTHQTILVPGLSAGWTYYIALMSADAASNWSALSNRAVVTTTDAVPPERIADLWAESRGSDGVMLRWTAPRDRSESGQAASYEVRYSLAEINEGAWESATRFPASALNPSAAGSPESLLVGGLDAETTYHFAIRSTDAFSNVSPVSNDIPYESVYAARTSPQNLLVNLRLAWIHRSYFEYERLFAPWSRFIFSPSDVGGPENIPPYWDLEDDLTDVRHIFSGAANHDGARLEQIDLDYDIGAPQDSVGVTRIEVSNVSLTATAALDGGGGPIIYQVTGSRGDFDIEPTDATDPGSGLPIYAITQWKDLPAPPAARSTGKPLMTQDTSWGRLKAIWW